LLLDVKEPDLSQPVRKWGERSKLALSIKNNRENNALENLLLCNNLNSSI
jgi:hypothetical protein